MTPYISVELDFLNALSSPVFIKNMASVYVYCNRSFETFLGLSSEQILNQTSFKAASSSFTEIDIASDHDVWQTRACHRYVSTVEYSDRLINVEVIKVPWLDDSKQMIGLIGTVTILSETIQSEWSNKLTQREKDVLKLLMTGSPVKKIADILGISSYTVNDHLKSIYRKLGVHSKGAALYKMAGDKEALS
jgi:DNA-binding CsgD family transcriptional regulator